MPVFMPTSMTDEAFIRGAARLLWANLTMAFPTKISDIVNLSSASANAYAAASGWNDLGATKTGIAIGINNTEQTFDVDQIYSDIRTLPTSWSVYVATSLSEMTLDRLAIAWEGTGGTASPTPGTTSIDVTPPEGPEKVLTIGTPMYYTQRRLAVLFQRPNTNKVRAYIFRMAQRTPQESTITHSKTGDQATVPVRWNVLADPSVTDIYQRFFTIRDQQ